MLLPDAVERVGDEVRHGEHGRAGVEGVDAAAVRGGGLDPAGPPAGDRLPLERPRPRDRPRRGAARPRARRGPRRRRRRGRSGRGRCAREAPGKRRGRGCSSVGEQARDAPPGRSRGTPVQESARRTANHLLRAAPAPRPHRPRRPCPSPEPRWRRRPRRPPPTRRRPWSCTPRRSCRPATAASSAPTGRRSTRSRGTRRPSARTSTTTGCRTGPGEYQPGDFVAPTGTPDEPRPGVRIYRDAQGVAAGLRRHRRRRLVRRGLRGRPGPALPRRRGPPDGPRHVRRAGRPLRACRWTSQARTLTYSQADYDAMFAALPQAVARTPSSATPRGWTPGSPGSRTDPTLLPAEYQLLSTLPEPWTVTDTLAAGVLITRTVASAGGRGVRRDRPAPRAAGHVRRRGRPAGLHRPVLDRRPQRRDDDPRVRGPVRQRPAPGRRSGPACCAPPRPTR